MIVYCKIISLHFISKIIVIIACQGGICLCSRWRIN